jgi:hypothetical protein
MSHRLIIFVCCLLLAACGGGGSDNIESPTVSAETTPPIVTLVGQNTINHQQGTDFTDPGATASDETDASLTVSVAGSVDSAAGSYTLTYSATDAAGNTGTATRTVIVADTLAPVITLVGDSLVSLSLNETYTEAGATATDGVDGDISVTVSGNIDSTIANDYSITYTATDSAGNTATVVRTVRVQNTDVEQQSVLVQGKASSDWDAGFNAFDAAIDYGECSNDGGIGCPSISWQEVEDEQRGTVLELTHDDSGSLAGFFMKSSSPIDMSSFHEGALLFDLKTISGDGRYTMKLDCVYPCTSGDQPLISAVGNEWTAVTVPLATLEQAGLDLSKIDTGIVIWATTHKGNQFRLDSVRFASSYSGQSSISGSDSPPADVDHRLTRIGAGSISNTINPASYRCVYDYGNWIYNAGVVSPGIAGCDTATGIPNGEPAPLLPQVTGEAATQPVAAHRWWGSASFIGEMAIGDPNGAGYITPDPIIARISNAGFRMMGIPGGLNVYGIDYGYRIPDPFTEVFDGMAIANSLYSNMQGYVKAQSDGSVTIEWQDQGNAVMEATFVHGSPYVFVEVYQGDMLIKTLREDGGEKGVYFQGENSLGLWTSVAGNTNYFLVTGDGATAFGNTSGNQISVANASQSYTITLMPSLSTPPQAMITLFEQHARTKVASVNIDYEVEATTQAVSIMRSYLNDEGTAVQTIAGLQPLHWKYLTSAFSDTGYQIRSARGITKFA